LFDIVRQSISMIDGPPIQKVDIRCRQIIQGGDGGIGLAMLYTPASNCGTGESILVVKLPHGFYERSLICSCCRI
jgi:hypothetical protein